MKNVLYKKIEERYNYLALNEKDPIKRVDFSPFSVRSLYSNVTACLNYARNALHKNPQSILDIGCGTGNYFHIFKKIFPETELIACDLIEDNVKSAMEKGYSKGYQTNMLSLYASFEKNSFDCLFSVETIEYISRDDYYPFFSQCHSLLKKDGIFILVYPNLESLIRFFVKAGNEDFPFKYTTYDIVDHINKAKFAIKMYFGTDLFTAYTFNNPDFSYLLKIFGFRIGLVMYKK